MSHTVLFDHVREMFSAAVSAVEPKAAVLRVLEDPTLFPGGTDGVYIAALGKAALPMVEAARERLGDRIRRAVAVTKGGHGRDVEGISIIEAGHPIPNEKSVLGAREILDLCRAAGEGDLVLVLVSGGGSALVTAPVDGITLDDIRRVNELLVESGADIYQINTVRKHLSRIKGGRLAKAAFPARVLTLVLSDVVGDDLSTIASGPTAPDPTTFADALTILETYRLKEKVPRSVLDHLEAGRRGEREETPTVDDPVFRRVTHVIVGGASTALSAAQQCAANLGYSPLVLSSMFEGDTGELARFHAAVAREVKRYNRPAAPPVCLISGGETTVHVTGSGRGGRNTHFALEFAKGIDGVEGVAGLFAGSDGTDGPTDAAGAFVSGDTISRARQKNLDAKAYIINSDSYTFFQALGDLFITGPTRTNVMDIRLVCIV
ncbi:MAG: glycerate kinase [Deltaproteobacteria bacterium]|nr:glycerate kinase [Candidatus Zymogenaceae bacterium]